MRFKIITSCFFSMILTVVCTHSGYTQAQVKVRSDVQNIVIGDQFRFFIEADVPDADKTRIDWATLPQLEGLEIIDTGKIDTTSTKERTLYKQQLILTGFDSGAYTFPALNFRVITNNKDTIRLTTDSVRINVQTIAVDTNKPIKPIKDIIAVKKMWWEYWPWIVAALALAGLIFMIVYLRKNRNKKVVETRVPPEKAHEKALRRLEELSHVNYFEQGKIKEYYTELTDILRDYLDERFGIPAGELTTDDLLKLAKQQTSLKKIRPDLKLIFRTADLAKFAKASPQQEEHILCLEAAAKLVNRTKILPEGGIKS